MAPAALGESMMDGRYESWKWGYHQGDEYVGDPHTPCDPRSANVVVIRLVWTTPCDPRSAKVIAIRDEIAISKGDRDQECNHDEEQRPSM